MGDSEGTMNLSTLKFLIFCVHFVDANDIEYCTRFYDAVYKIKNLTGNMFPNISLQCRGQGYIVFDEGEGNILCNEQCRRQGYPLDRGSDEDIGESDILAPYPFEGDPKQVTKQLIEFISTFAYDNIKIEDIERTGIYRILVQKTSLFGNLGIGSGARRLESLLEWRERRTWNNMQHCGIY